MIRILILVFAIAFPFFVQAEELSREERQELALKLLEKGIAAYQEHRYKEAAQYYALSIQNWATDRASANLCNLYLYGQGVEQNYDLAFKLCSAAAQVNDPHALIMLGEMYLYGKGVAADRGKAISYYQKAAEQGHSQAQYVLGLLFSNSGTDGNLDKSIYWLEKANRNGYPDAEALLRKIKSTKPEKPGPDNGFR